GQDPLGGQAHRRLYEQGRAVPDLLAGAVARHDLGGAGGGVLQVDQPPTFAERRVDPHVAGVVDAVEDVVRHRGQDLLVGGEDQAVLDPVATRQGDHVPAAVLGPHVQVEADVLRLVPG